MFSDKKFGLPKDLIEATKKVMVEGHMTFHYENSDKAAKVVRNPDTDEWVVKHYLRGVHQKKLIILQVIKTMHIILLRLMFMVKKEWVYLMITKN